MHEITVIIQTWWFSQGLFQYRMHTDLKFHAFFFCYAPNTAGFLTIYGYVERLQLAFWAKTSTAKIGMTDCFNKQFCNAYASLNSFQFSTSSMKLSWPKAFIFSSEILTFYLLLVNNWDPREEITSETSFNELKFWIFYW